MIHIYLILQRKLPQDGWDDLSIEHFLHEIALMDSNNFAGIIDISNLLSLI